MYVGGLSERLGGLPDPQNTAGQAERSGGVGFPVRVVFTASLSLGT